jgi:glyoxylate reductase
MKRIYITRQLMPIAKELLSRHFSVDENPKDEPLARDELKRIVKEYDGILSTIPDRLDRDLLSSANLKVISNCAAGLDNVDLGAAKEKNITVFNVPDATTESTADLTFAILLSLIRRVGEAQQYVKDGRWRGWEPALLLGEELSGKNFGIIGYGKIGKAVAARALGFGLKVLVYTRSPIKDSRVRQVGLDELYAESDYISIHAPLTPQTLGMIDKAAIQKMNRRPILINMARGSMIKTDELIDALMQGGIRGAALDVTDPEPIGGSHPLCHLKNCLVLPHIGSATVECRTMMSRVAAENLIGYFRDQS